MTLNHGQLVEFYTWNVHVNVHEKKVPKHYLILVNN